MIDAVTKRWIRNASDERAAANGCRFDEGRGQEVVDWIQTYCHLYEGEYAGRKMELADWQYEVTMRLFGWVKQSVDWKREVRRFRKAGIWLPKKNAKALALDTEIPTASGWKLVSALKVGDVLFTESGGTCVIQEVHPVIVDEETYRLTFSNGEVVVCNGDHLWETSVLQERVAAAGNAREFRGNGSTGSLGKQFSRVAVRTTRDIAGSLLRGDGARNHSIRMPQPVDLPPCELQMDPYVFGCWLGDGDSDSSRITCAAYDFQSYEALFAARGYCVRRMNSHDADRFVFQGPEEKRARTTLREMNVFKNKHIPAVYLRSSLIQRAELLRGLMDTDGSVDKSGTCLTYTTKLPELAIGFEELLSSLGIKHSRQVRTPVISGRKREYYTIQFSCSRDYLEVFNLDRKLSRMRTGEQSRARTLQITSAKRVPAVASRCITVSNPTGMFLCGRTMIPTHNSPSLAAWGLYLLCGDGEMGQKIYSAAKDGKQAMISHTHAMEMVRMSPELTAECDINKSTGQITHLPTRSFYKVVAGDNVNSQEGLNGSVMIDETHVVDRRLAGVLKGAGISRSEPFQIEVSTAGSNPDGYGKDQRDYGTAVAKGEIHDEQFLFQEYAAPQDVGDEDLDKNIIAYGKLANPTWGRIIRESEFLADYNSSKHSIDKLANFKMYRLNIWQRSSNPWLKGGDWDKCRKNYGEEDLLGEACVAGLDLSKTRDMSALVLVFPDMEEDEAIRILAHFWLPEKYAFENKHLAPFLEWQKAGALTLTQGSVIDYGAIRAKFHEWADKFRISKLVYDHRFAEETTQALSDGLYGASGVLLEEGTGIERKPFLQTVDNYTPVIEEFERLVIAGKAHHNGNPVLTWQAGHVCKKPTGGTSKGSILVKPQTGDIKKIDGMVATLMALSMYHDISAKSVYDQKGNFAL